MTLPEWVDRARYWLGVLVVLSLPPALIWWIVIHPFVGFWRRVGSKGTLWILGIGYLAMMAAAFPFRRFLVGTDLGFHWPLLIPAVPLMVATGIIQSRRKRHLTFRILAGVPELQAADDHLLTEGIYGRIRHPRYVEFTLGILAWGCLINYLGAWIIIVASIGLLWPITRFEDRELESRFGDRWREYASRVPRFIPRSAPRR